MPESKLFSFNTLEHSDYHLEFVSFRGEEIVLVSKNEDIDISKLINSKLFVIDCELSMIR